MINDDLLNILKQCRKHSPNAQRQLYSDFYRFGLSVCMRYVVNLETAQELLNDSFLKVFININKYNENMVFVTWFKKIIVNTCIDYLRQSNKNISLVEVEEATDVGVEIDIFERFSVEEIGKLIHQLPQAYRTVFNLHVIEGYSHREIADLLDIEVGTSTSNLNRARKKLQELIILNEF